MLKYENIMQSYTKINPSCDHSCRHQKLGLSGSFSRLGNITSGLENIKHSHFNYFGEFIIMLAAGFITCFFLLYLTWIPFFSYYLLFFMVMLSNKSVFRYIIKTITCNPYTTIHQNINHKRNTKCWLNKIQLMNNYIKYKMLTQQNTTH